LWAFWDASTLPLPLVDDRVAPVRLAVEGLALDPVDLPDDLGGAAVRMNPVRER
jgi:hypothetical protein